MKIYDLDQASTTKLKPSVLKKMKPFLNTAYGNPSSMHHMGIHSKKIINESKKGIAKLLNCEYDELIFTGSGTEAINLAIKGYAFSQLGKKEIITTPIEHKATLNTCLYLEKLGYDIKYVKIDETGMIDVEDLERIVSEQTLLVTIIWANNEIGTIQDLDQITKIVRKYDAKIHIDAVQMIGHFPIDLKLIDVDMMSFSAHKLYGPKGIGMLYKKKNLEIEPLIHGGGQEFNLRSGTENISGIVGFYEALKIAYQTFHHQQKYLNEITSALLNLLQQKFDFKYNGTTIGDTHLPGLLSLSFHHIKGNELQYQLNQQGVLVSTGSACSENSIGVSHVIKALHQQGEGTIRISLGYHLKKKDIQQIIKRFTQSIEALI